jgi:hypothetical protein
MELEKTFLFAAKDLSGRLNASSFVLYLGSSLAQQLLLSRTYK